MSTSRRHGRLRRVLFFVPLVALWAVPIAAFVVLAPQADQHEVTALAATQPTTSTVGERAQDFARPVGLEVTLTSGAPVLSPADGTVTQVWAHKGDTLTTGTALAEVNGEPVYAQVGGVPLYRELGKGATGGDVESLCRLLAAKHYYYWSSCTKVDKDVVSAIKAFQKDHGMKPTGTFSPTWTVYLPNATSEVSAVLIKTGQKIDTTTPLVETGTAMKSVRLVADPTSGKSMSDFGDNPVTLNISGKTYALNKAEIPAKLAAQVYRTIRKQVKAGTLVDSASAAIQPGADASRSASGSGSGGSTTSPTTTYTGATAQLATPQTVGTVPGSAVYSAATGTSCVFTVTGSTTGAAALDAARAQPLDTIGMVVGEIGVAAVDGSLIGTPIISDASTLPATTLATCE